MLKHFDYLYDLRVSLCKCDKSQNLMNCPMHMLHMISARNTVSHFSYAPFFKGPHFSQNAGIEHSL